MKRATTGQKKVVDAVCRKNKRACIPTEELRDSVVADEKQPQLV